MELEKTNLFHATIRFQPVKYLKKNDCMAGLKRYKITICLAKNCAFVNHHVRIALLIGRKAKVGLV